MTPAEIVRVYLGNIETTRRVMEDGKTGYVLQFDTHMSLLCVNKGKVRKDHPLNHDVAVLTHAQAVTMQRYWNHEHPDDKVRIILRREAMVAYIDEQQRGIEMLQSLSRLIEEQQK
jgi:hypothetical protein